MQVSRVIRWGGGFCLNRHSRILAKPGQCGAGHGVPEWESGWEGVQRRPRESVSVRGAPGPAEPGTLAPHPRDTGPETGSRAYGRKMSPTADQGWPGVGEGHEGLKTPNNFSI